MREGDGILFYNKTHPRARLVTETLAARALTPFT
jgi:hypothetical protein